MKLDIYITDRISKETRIYKDTWDFDLDQLDYQWSEGDFGCDCNRALFFARAIDKEKEADGRGCGEKRFYVRITNSKTNEEVYRD